MTGRVKEIKLNLLEIVLILACLVQIIQSTQ